MSDLEDVAREELIDLWADLHTARRCAYPPGAWSMHCEGLQARIVALTALVGPAPWENIQMPLLLDGVYQRIHAEMGIEVTPDMDHVRDLWGRYLEENRRV